MDSEDHRRKKEWKSGEKEIARANFPLPDAMLADLFKSIETAVARDGCDHSRRFTEDWLSGHAENPEPLIAWLEENGGFCDCEVLANAHDHWQQNR